MSDLYIIGAGGHGKVVANAARLMNKWSNIYFVDEKSTIKGTRINVFLVIGNLADALKKSKPIDEFIVAIGDNKIRKDILYQLVEKRKVIAKVIHPTAVIDENVHIGIGTVILAGVVVNSSSIIGDGVILNTSSSVDHDCKVGDFSHLSPGARLGGTVEVGSLVWLGMNSTTIPNLKVADNVTVGAAGLVLKDIEEAGVYVGQPVNKTK